MRRGRRNVPEGCSVCGKPVGDKFKPFCSARCRDVDLNRWLSGVYAIPATEETDEDGERPREDDKE